MSLNKRISIRDNRLRNKTDEKGIMSFIRSQNLELGVPSGLDNVDNILRRASKIQPNKGQRSQNHNRDARFRDYQILQRSVSTTKTILIDRPDRQTRRRYKVKNAIGQ